MPLLLVTVRFYAIPLLFSSMRIRAIPLLFPAQRFLRGSDRLESLLFHSFATPVIADRCYSFAHLFRAVPCFSIAVLLSSTLFLCYAISCPAIPLLLKLFLSYHCFSFAIPFLCFTVLTRAFPLPFTAILFIAALFHCFVIPICSLPFLCASVLPGAIP